MTATDSHLTFDLDRIRARSFVRNVEHHDEACSTNDLALGMAAEPQLGLPALVLATRQTAGRGRGANRWWSAPGALTLSLILSADEIQLAQDRWPQVSLATAVAVCATLEELVPAARFGVKWPNDVHCEGRKICGILVEVPNHRTPAARRLVLGIGLNVNNSWQDAPEHLAGIGTSLCDLTGRRHDLTDVLVRLLAELDVRLAQLRQGDPRLPDAWRTLCLLRGHRVQVDLGPRSAVGICEGIDDDGSLVLRTPAGQERLFGGVVRVVADFTETQST